MTDEKTDNPGTCGQCEFFGDNEDAGSAGHGCPFTYGEELKWCPPYRALEKLKEILIPLYKAMEADAAPLDVSHALGQIGKVGDRIEFDAELLMPIALWGEALDEEVSGPEGRTT